MGTRNTELGDTVSDLKEFVVQPKRCIVYKINRLVLIRQMQNQVFDLNQPIKYRLGSDVAQWSLMWKRLWRLFFYRFHYSRAKCCSERHWGDELALWEDLIQFHRIHTSGVFSGYWNLRGDRDIYKLGKVWKPVTTRTMLILNDSLGEMAGDLRKRIQGTLVAVFTYLQACQVKSRLDVSPSPEAGWVLTGRKYTWQDLQVLQM